jgi:hypothetical protein
MAADFAIVCKTFRRDLHRLERLLASLARNNPQRLPLVICVPRADAELFAGLATAAGAALVLDEDVVAAHPRAQELDLPRRYRETPGGHSQQVVKSEVWRLIGCDSYLCADADTVFLRPIVRSDFVTPAGHPYTILHQSREYLQFALDRGRDRVVEHFLAESRRVKSLFGRDGPDYDFGPQPLLWSARVWSDLDTRWLAPRGMTLWDAIKQAPSEIRWYGEALLALKSIPLDPVEPLFRVYHHDWQYETLRRIGETDERVARNYLGAVYQSNWDVELDPREHRSTLSRWARKVRRLAHRVRV